MIEPLPDANRLRWIRRLFLGALVALLLHVVAVAAWEDLARPGLGRLGRSIASAVTFGSSQVRDVAYQLAASDPLQLPSLLLLLLASVVVPALYFTSFQIVYWRHNPPAPPSGRMVKAAARAHLSLSGYLDRRLRRVTILGMCLGISLFILAIATYSIVVQAVVIHGAFHTDLVRLAPHISEQEAKTLAAEFTYVNKRSDFLNLRTRMEALAAPHSVKLSASTTW
jgi:hypothetical protein